MSELEQPVDDAHFAATNGSAQASAKKAVQKPEDGVGKEPDVVPASPHEDVVYKKRLVKSSGENKKWKRPLWLGGHFSVIVFGSISILFQVFWIPNRYYINSICYRLAILGFIAALFATVSHKFGIKNLPPLSTLTAQQNFQYMVLGIVWLFTFKSIFKLLPYVLISLLHFASTEKITPIINQDQIFASAIAYDELVLIVYLFLRTLFFRNTSGYQLVLYLAFYWLRILFNKETSTLFKAIMDRLDGKVTGLKNEKVVTAWKKSKRFIDMKSK